jgi:hypothetical protein
MSKSWITFEALAIGLAVLGVLVAFAIHVVHSFGAGARKIVEFADSRAERQRTALLKGEPSVTRRIAGAVCITALVVLLACAFARKINLI